MDKKDEQLLHELKAFRRQLSDHDSLTRTREAISQFFCKEGQEITIKLTANTCGSEVKVTVNSNDYSSRDIRSFDLHELVRHSIREESK